MQVDLTFGDILMNTASKPEYFTCIFIIGVEEAKSSKDLKRRHKVRSSRHGDDLTLHRRTNAGLKQNKSNSVHMPPLLLHAPATTSVSILYADRIGSVGHNRVFHTAQRSPTCHFWTHTDAYKSDRLLERASILGT